MLDFVVNYLGPAAFIGAIIAVLLWRLEFWLIANIIFAISSITIIATSILPVNTWTLGDVTFIMGLIAWLWFLFAHQYRDDKGFFSNIILATLKAFGILLVLLFLGVASEAGSARECKESHSTTHTMAILSATDNYSINGSFSGGGCIVYYVSGSISEDAVYRYYYQLDDGGIKQGKIPANKTTIYYIGDEETPYLETIIAKMCCGYSTSAFYGRSVDEPYHLVIENSTDTTYKLYVPEGSIQQIFQFDGS